MVMNLSTGLSLGAMRAAAAYNPGTQTGAQIAAAIAAAANGSTVEIDPIAGQTVTLTGVAKTGVTVQQIGGQPLQRMVLTSVTGLRFLGVTTIFNNASGADFNSTDTTQLCVARTASNVEFEGCRFNSNSGPNKKKRFGGIRATASTIAIRNCIFEYLQDAVVANTTTVTAMNGCAVHHIVQDALTGNEPDVLECHGNDFTFFEGDYGKRFYGTITGALSVGETLSNGATGTAQKVIEVVETQAGYIHGYYNNFAAPVVSETYTGASGSITLTSITSEFDGAHGDVLQPLNNTATANRIVRFTNNTIMRTTPFDHSIRCPEQGVQGVLMQLNNPTGFGWSEVKINGNIIMGGQQIGIEVAKALSGEILFNTVVGNEFGNFSRITLSQCDGVTVRRNIGNNTLGGVIVDEGGNTNMTINENVNVSSAADVLVAPFVYPQARANMRPIAGSSVDLANAGAVALDGSFRPTTMPPPPSGPRIVEAATVRTFSSGSTTVSQSFTASAGSNRRVLVSVSAPYTTQNAATLSLTWAGQPLRKLAERQSNTPNAFERVALFEVIENEVGAWPAGATGSLVATASIATPSDMAISAVTLENIGAGAPVIATFGAGSVPATGSITPSVAGSLVVGVFHGSGSNSASTWSAGLTRIGATAFAYGSPLTATDLWGSAIHGTTSLTCTTDFGTMRWAGILAAFPPV